MNPRQLKLVAVLLGVAFLLYSPRFFRDDGAGGSLEVTDGFRFALTDPLTRIDIIQVAARDTIRLDRVAAGWTVDGFRADSLKVADLIPVLTNLGSDVLLARNPSNHAAMEVDERSGRRIEVYTEAGGPLAFKLGKRDLTAGGYYVRLPDADPVFRLDGPAGGYLSRDREGWRVRLIAQVDTSAVRELVFSRDGQEVVVRRSDAGWMAGDSPADTSAVMGVLRMLPSIRATGFPSEEDVVAADFSAPQASLDVFAEDEGDVTGRRLVLSLRFIEDENAGDWLAREADGAEVYRLATFNINRLLPERLIP